MLTGREGSSTSSFFAQSIFSDLTRVGLEVVVGVGAVGFEVPYVSVVPFVAEGAGEDEVEVEAGG